MNNRYIVLDTETATLPYANKYSGEQKKKISIAKPLIYDIGWTVVDENGTIYKKVNYLITEIFSIPSIFNTAYYKDKRPKYLEEIKNGNIQVRGWNEVADLLEKDLAECTAVGAFNAMFDFKKAICFTDLYISKIYSPDFAEWEQMQNDLCDKIATETSNGNYRTFDRYNFEYRGKKYPLFDLWGLACKYLLNNDEYKKMCISNNWKTASGKYFKTSAETSFRYIAKQLEFEESHTALDDALIESKILGEVIKKNNGKLEMGIIYFPFRELGRADLMENAT